LATRSFGKWSIPLGNGSEKRKELWEGIKTEARTKGIRNGYGRE